MSSAKTRIIRREGGRPRDEASNDATRMLRYERALEPAAFRTLFVRNYPVIRDVCTRHTRTGVAVIAIDAYTGRLRSSLWLASKLGLANAAIIGRHCKSDLWLEDDASLSLRHLALLLSPDRGDGEVCVRILDLRTQSAFHDERGRQYESLVSEGPLFVRCGSHAIFLLVTGDGVSWPDDANDGWACIPERVYLDGEDAEPDRWQRQRPSVRHASADATEGGDSRADSTIVRRMRGPVQVGTRLLAAGERPLGCLSITVGQAQQDLAVGPQAAHAGVLLGRYERCDGEAGKVLVAEGISRIHLLLVTIDGRLHAVDTASTNGTQRAGDDQGFHVVPLEDGNVLTLAGGVATLRWYTT